MAAAAPIRIRGGTGALASGGAIQVQLDQRSVARVVARLDQNRGAPLGRRLQLATLKAADLLRGPIAAAAPVKTGTLKRSVRARPMTQRFGFSSVPTFDAQVGPTAPHAHLVIQGHRIVTKLPGHRYLGRSTRPNPFVDRVAAVMLPRALEVVRQEAFV